MRCADLGPIPGNRPSSSMRSWTAAAYIPVPTLPVNGVDRVEQPTREPSSRRSVDPVEPSIPAHRRLLAQEAAEFATHVHTTEGLGRLGVRLLDHVAQGGQDEILQQIDIGGIDDGRIDADMLELQVAGGAHPYGATTCRSPRAPWRPPTACACWRFCCTSPSWESKAARSGTDCSSSLTATPPRRPEMLPAGAARARVPPPGRLPGRRGRRSLEVSRAAARRRARRGVGLVQHQPEWHGPAEMRRQGPLDLGAVRLGPGQQALVGQGEDGRVVDAHEAARGHVDLHPRAQPGQDACHPKRWSGPRGSATGQPGRRRSRAGPAAADGLTPDAPLPAGPAAAGPAPDRPAAGPAPGRPAETRGPAAGASTP